MGDSDAYVAVFISAISLIEEELTLLDATFETTTGSLNDFKLVISAIDISIMKHNNNRETLLGLGLSNEYEKIIDQRRLKLNKISYTLKQAIQNRTRELCIWKSGLLEITSHIESIAITNSPDENKLLIPTTRVTPKGQFIGLFPTEYAEVMSRRAAKRKRNKDGCSLVLQSTKLASELEKINTAVTNLKTLKSNEDHFKDDVLAIKRSKVSVISNQFTSSDLTEQQKDAVSLKVSLSQTIQRQAMAATRHQKTIDAKTRNRTANLISKSINTFWNHNTKIIQKRCRDHLEKRKREIMQDKKELLLEEARTMSNELQSQFNITTSDKVDFGLDSSPENLVKIPTELMSLSETKTLRPYQHTGLTWLVSLHERGMSGILADEMGLGKTIQTIALLAYLALNENNWGPHLVVVPTSVLLNWEIEFRRWAPQMKLLVYYGTQKVRQKLRKGWSRPSEFDVCIVSYQTCVTDAAHFKRVNWEYLILDEAHMIKNYKSKKWQVLRQYKTARRLLLSGTPLQNNIMELWSLLRFLMSDNPLFSSESDFNHWFNNPVTQMIQDGVCDSKIVEQLHVVLRPFILRRLKRQVAHELPTKIEKVIRCRLAKRQRTLYDEYMRSGETRTRLSGRSYVGVMGVLMQLRKVCNHPSLFEPRPTSSPFCYSYPESVVPQFTVTAQFGDSVVLPRLLLSTSLKEIPETLKITSNVAALHFSSSKLENPGDIYRRYLSQKQSQASIAQYSTSTQEMLSKWIAAEASVLQNITELQVLLSSPYDDSQTRLGRGKWLTRRNARNCCSEGLMNLLTPILTKLKYVSVFDGGLLDVAQTVMFPNLIKKFRMIVKKATAVPRFTHNVTLRIPSMEREREAPVLLPDPKLIQFDCGKLQVLAKLLPSLKRNGHRVLIFTQMSKVLDILEEFLSMHDLTYLRLDGSTKVEDRAYRMGLFNTNTRYFCFILSTRSGGIGINLTGADTVIFYDTDWNPAIDLQAQDRCHRIGQTKNVRVYRLISRHTVEENILMTSRKKKTMFNIVIKGGNFDSSAGMEKTNVESFFHPLGDDEIAKLEAQENQAEDENNDPAIDQSNGVDKYLSLEVEDPEDRAAFLKSRAETHQTDEEFQETTADQKNETSSLTPLQQYAQRIFYETRPLQAARMVQSCDRQIKRFKEAQLRDCN